MRQALAHPKLPTLIRCFLGVNFVAIGIAHFVMPEPFVAIVPPYLPWHHELVYLSGCFEIAGGLGLFIPRTRTIAAWGLVALLFAVYPANIHMLVNEVYIEGLPKSKLALYLRMPMQFVFMFLIIWSCKLWPRAQKISTS